MADGMTMLAEQETCSRNLYFKEWLKRIIDAARNARNTVATGHTLSDSNIRFYQGQVAAFDRVLHMPDEIIDDCKPKEETGEPSI